MFQTQPLWRYELLKMPADRIPIRGSLLDRTCIGLNVSRYFGYAKVDVYHQVRVLASLIGTRDHHADDYPNAFERFRRMWDENYNYYNFTDQSSRGPKQIRIYFEAHPDYPNRPMDDLLSAPALEAAWA